MREAKSKRERVHEEDGTEAKRNQSDSERCGKVQRCYARRRLTAHDPDGEIDGDGNRRSQRYPGKDSGDFEFVKVVFGSRETVGPDRKSFDRSLHSPEEAG